MSLYARLVELERQDPGAIAVIPALTRRELLARVHAPTASPVDDDPVEAVVAQLAAQAAGRTVFEVRTSGSTGAGRPVRRSVASWMASLPAFDALIGLRTGPGEVVWAPGGASSTLTLYALWQALAAGVPAAVTGPWRGVVPPAERATVVQCVPLVLEEVLRVRRAGGLPRLRTAVVAGAAPSPTARARAEAGGLRLVEYYGAAELSFVAVDVDGAGLRPFPGVEVDLRDGVLWVRSAYLADTAHSPRDAQGWATVGDRAELQANGTLRLLGRGGASASVAGHIILLAQVERVLATAAGVAEAVCLSEPHPVLGERVVAVLRPASAQQDPVPAARAAARQVLAPAARPARYLVRSELPRTSAGKVARTELADQIRQIEPPRESTWTPTGR